MLLYVYIFVNCISTTISKFIPFWSYLIKYVYSIDGRPSKILILAEMSATKEGGGGNAPRIQSKMKHKNIIMCFVKILRLIYAL